MSVNHRDPVTGQLTPVAGIGVQSDTTLAEKCMMPDGETNVADEIEEINNTLGGLSLKSKTIIGALSAKQYGNVVSINGYAKIDSISANTDLTIGNIGDLTPPNDTIRGMCILCENAYDSTGDIAYFVVGTNGSVIIKTATARTNWYVRVSVTYIA